MPKLDFLNADLELIFKREPKILLSNPGERAIVLYSGEHPEGHFVSMELSACVKDPVRSLRRWFKYLQSLPPAARREFLKATSRTFDLGFVVGADRQAIQIKLPTDLLTELARWKAGYVITPYEEETGPRFESGAPRPGANTRR